MNKKEIQKALEEDKKDLKENQITIGENPTNIKSDTKNIDMLTVEILILKQQTAQNIIEIGKRLIEAQKQLGEGESFRSWLKEKVQFGKSTAYNFIRVAKEFDNVQALGQLGQSKVFAILDLPSEEREEFISTPHEINGQEKMVDEMTTRELQKVIKERDDALKTLENARKISDENSERVRKLFDEKCKAESELRTTDQVLRDTQRDVKNLQDTLTREREKSKKETTRLENSIIEINKQLSEAQTSGNDEEIKRLQASLQEAQEDLDSSAKKIDELEAQLESKPIDVITAAPDVIEKIPEAIEKELEELRKKANQNGNPLIVEFKVNHTALNQICKKQLEIMTEIKEADPEMYEKCKKGITDLMKGMLERL